MSLILADWSRPPHAHTRDDLVLVHASPEFLMNGIPTWSDLYEFGTITEHPEPTNCPTWTDAAECRCMTEPL